MSWGWPVSVSSYTVVFIYESWSSFALFLALISAFMCWCAVKQSVNLGPCLWFVPFLLCSWGVAKHTLHVPHFLFAFSDNDQVCECGAAGNARLVEGDEGTGRLIDVTGLLRIIPSWSARTLVFVVILDSLYFYRTVRHIETVRSMVVMFMFSFSRTTHSLHDELTSVVKAMTMTMATQWLTVNKQVKLQQRQCS